MDLLPHNIQNYAEAHTSPENDVLQQLNRETHLKVMLPQMLSGQMQGRFLSLLSHMVQPKRVLEIGTYTGYSAICLAEGLAEGGKIHTIDINEELEEMAKKYFAKAVVEDKIEMHIGNALEIIPQLDEKFDLVFIDADKQNYSNYFDLVIDKVRTGGLIVADNVLWSGRVVEEKKDKDTQALDAYNKKIVADKRVECLLLPLRDGLMIARKTG